MQAARMLNPEMAKEMETRRVPGYGIAKSIPVPEDARQKLMASEQLDNTAKDLVGFAQTHTTLNPMSKDYNVGMQKVLNLQNQYRNSDIGGIYKQGDQPLLEKISPDNPAGLNKAWSTIPKLQELIAANNRKRALTVKQYELQPSASMRAAMAPAPASNNIPEGATGTYKGQPVVRQNGTWVPR
jgi:hypothetical protein